MIKGITLTQAWASLVALKEIDEDAKGIETRSWSTTYRGTLAIHAAKGFPPEARLECFRKPIRSMLERHSEIFPGLSFNVVTGAINGLPLGKIVAVCELTAVHRIPYSPQHFPRFDHYTNFPRFAHYRNHLLASYPFVLPPFQGTNERAFGDYSHGRYAWILTDIKALPTPIPCKGALSLWDVPAEVEAQIMEQLCQS